MTIRAPAFLSKSRPSSPGPTRADRSPPSEADGTLPTRRPLSRLQNPFKRSTSASPAPLTHTQLAAFNAALDTASPLPGVGAQYLDSLGLKFAEAASNALANPVGPVTPNANTPGSAATASNDPCAQLLKGRRPFPPGRGAALGALITTELSRSADVHLSRAIVRTLQRPLSVLLNNISGLLMPILPYVTTPATSQLSAPATASSLAQSHALGIARLAAELLEALKGINTSVIVGAGGVDYLRGTRDGLEVLVQRVVNPLLSNIKIELGPVLDKLSAAPELEADGQAPSALPALTAALPGITMRLDWYTSPGVPAHSAHAALLISLVWRALVALSSRPLADPFTFMGMKKPRSREGMNQGGKDKTSPGLKAKKDLPFVSALSRPATINGASTPNGAATPNGIATAPPAVASGPTPPATPRFGRIGLPLTSISRPPSPTSSSGVVSKSKGAPASLPVTPLQRLLADTSAVQAMLGTLSKPPCGCLAFEAVDEAFDALAGFKTMLKWLVDEAVAQNEGPAKSLQDIVEQLLEAAEDVPCLIALNVLVQLVSPEQLSRRMPGGDARDESTAWRAIAVPELLNMEVEEYRTSCLAGFSRADAAVDPVGHAVLDALETHKRPLMVRSVSSSSTVTFSPAASLRELPGTPGLLSSQKGLDLRVLRAWLMERIATNDDDNKDTPIAPSLPASTFAPSVASASSTTGLGVKLAPSISSGSSMSTASSSGGSGFKSA
ncbi:hypothetical protein DL93DRAFT_776343 [Clavulina sp. PMI_390]|nr:hypothetical protein DL93DRAFT_776343 [Clavulina sp. PMI_390]